jgi:hypothetical protein
MTTDFFDALRLLPASPFGLPPSPFYYAKATKKPAMADKYATKGYAGQAGQVTQIYTAIFCSHLGNCNNSI